MTKSVTLNKDMKEGMMHTFYRKATEAHRLAIQEKIDAFRDEWLDLFFGPYQKTLLSLPEPFRRSVTKVAIPRGYVPPKAPKKRTKGKIEPTDRTTYSLNAMCEHIRLFPEHWRPALQVRRELDYLSVPEDIEIYGPTWEDWTYHTWDRFSVAAVKDKVVTKAALNKFCKDRFVPLCQEIDGIIDEVEEAVQGVGVILKAARTTKSLRDQWPEVDNYVELPVESKGSIARLVDIHHVNEVLAKTWPAEETA